MLRRIPVTIINIYQKYIRMSLPISCRFSPSCSEYAKQAIIKYGVLPGILKAVKRIARCNPYSQKAGYDPLL